MKRGSLGEALGQAAKELKASVKKAELDAAAKKKERDLQKRRRQGRTIRYDDRN